MIRRIQLFTWVASLAAAVLLMASCQQDELVQVPTSVGNGSGLSLTFSSDPMEEYKVGTRSSDAKDDAEKRINSLHIFFFDAGGNWLEGSYLTGYPTATEDGGYITPGQGSTLVKIANEAQNFVDPSAAETALVYAVANVESELFGELDANGRPQVLRDRIDAGLASTPLEALQTLTYTPRTLITTAIPDDTGMPMVGSKEVNLMAPSATTDDERVIELTALMARIDVDISLESETTDNNLPSMLLTKWTAVNLPKQVSFTATAAEGTTALTDEGKTTFSSESTQLIYNRGNHITFSFYMFENVQQPASVPAYPAGENGAELTDAQKQRYKPDWAGENAAYVEFETQYTTYNNASYEVKYKLYLGSDHIDNYEVKRNHQYKNNLVIKGLTAHDTNAGDNSGEYTYDARVNIEETNNKYYISILRERNHDAHFCVTPMDVYFFDEASQPTLKIEFLNSTDMAGGDPWIRMEKIPAANMEAGTLPAGMSEGDHLIAGGNFTAGHAKRRYFTTDLVTNTLRDAGSTVTLDANRDRVYFYIDENLFDSQDRTATLKLTYYENGAYVSERTLDITQTHFLRVQVYGRDGNRPDYSRPYSADEGGVIYMEQYEEYLDHYDPLDKYDTEQIYTGLEWGLDGEWIRSWGDGAAQNNYLEGLAYTNQIVSDAGQTTMTLNGTPRSAAEYCYNKNKREADGSILSGDWHIIYRDPDNRKYFLPGIRQMEDALTQYYQTFREFQDNFYWSSAAGKSVSDYLPPYQSTDRARATKVNADGTYVESAYGNNYPNGGATPRTGVYLRIRAFRSDLEPLGN